MSTKKDAAAQLIWLAKEMRRELGGDSTVDEWASFLDAIAYGLDRPTADRLMDYGEVATSRKVRLRNLIEHRSTPQPEREAALAVLERMRVAGDGE